MELPDHLLPGPVFAVARGYLARAQAGRAHINALWNLMRTERAMRGWSESQGPLIREVWCAFAPSGALRREADEAMAAFLLDLKAALDACVLATANAVCRPIGFFVEPEHHEMPLLASPADFDALVDHGQLSGLRPDQIRALRPLQPFAGRLNSESAATRTIARDMAHLAVGLDALGSRTPAQGVPRLFTVWASEADPEPELPVGLRIERTEIDPAGPVHERKRLATFTLADESAGASFRGSPNVGFDVILNAGPWPDDPDDNFAQRSHGLLVITRLLIEGLERSVSEPYRTDLLRALQLKLPEERVDTWLPVRFSGPERESEARNAIAESHRGLATYLDDEDRLVYMRLDADGAVVGRTIAPAQDLLAYSRDGAAVENATRAAAGRWGLRDLVLRPQQLQKGNGTRELGDGTILAGRRGLSLQVKARGVTGDTPDKATRWILKEAAHGLRQARGTIRTVLLNPDAELTNLRGRSIRLRGRAVDWIPVVVIDHPNPPHTGVFPARDLKGPSVVLTRRDWEFLWDQLRSATAVVDYIHRVAQEDEPFELGAESDRYLDLADQDAQVPHRQAPDWIHNSEVGYVSFPRLPQDPAASPDRFGHAVFQQVLEDIANTDFTGNEGDRLLILSHIDRVPVATRAELGRLLLDRLIECAEAAPDGQRVEHRNLYIDDSDLQLTFSTMSQLAGPYQEIYKSWLLVRRQDFLTRTGARGPIYPWTVGVLLTPRADGPRPWDTTMIATNGPPAYDAAQHTQLSSVFSAVQLP